ncbi:protein kinase domain-containing protein [Pirellula sp. SH-Sr6A]|uniref:protein kinase domain-containing protein n=1 Tax=Pirellula sp. SH-Sr6A TaxID=1632865 RepID=UPI0011BA92C9|nr:protein kinase [Pirellula sp. SH-Sr6A]
MMEWADSSSESEPERRPKTQGKPEVKTDQIASLWKQSIVTNSDLHRTIKSDTGELTVSDSVYSIQPREIMESKDLQFGTSLDYELLEVIGEGGVGVVYAARQASIDRRVAIKMLRDEYRVRPEHRDKFLAEAVLTGELDHPNIVPIYDLGRNKDGELFYAMKNVVGTPWDRVINSQTLELNLEILHKVADAVAFAHSRGVIHRDLKPENVMLGGFGEVLVMDWGIAMPTEGFNKSSSILRSQAMGGTPAYMAPELASGPVERIGRASDVYLLGAILFEILSGKPPHDGNDVLECVRNAANNVIVETDRSGELMDIAMKAMETIPGRRYRTVQDFQKAIRNFEYHRESLALMESAKAELIAAEESANYAAFNHVIFAFGEAIKLWPENAEAREGLTNARMAYAEAAYRKEDFDLGLSVLEEEEFNAPELIARLKRGQSDRAARQARFTAIRRIAVVLGAFILVTGSLGSCVILFLYSRSVQLNDDLLGAQEELKGLVLLANDAKTVAEAEKQNAIQEQQRAETQTRIAESARLAADKSRLETASEKRKADESAYFAEIGLIGASIQQNSFLIAWNLLNGLEQSDAKSKLRHWEWGRFRFLVQGGTQKQTVAGVRTIDFPEDVVAIDSLKDGQQIAYGLLNGEFGLIDTTTGQKIASGRAGDRLFAIAFSPETGRIATSAWSAEHGYSVKVWLRKQDAFQAEDRNLDTTRIDSLAFHPDSHVPVLVGGGERKTVKVWNWKDGQTLKTFVGHLEGVACVRYSPDQRWIASSSTDGTVRVWDASQVQNDESSEVQRFSEHTSSVLSLDFSPDGRRIASGDSGGNIMVWPVSIRQAGQDAVQEIQLAIQGVPPKAIEYQHLRGHESSVHCIRFAQNGEDLVSCGSDNLVCLWKVPREAKKEASPVSRTSNQTGNSTDAQDGNVSPSRSFRGHGGWIRSCAFVGDRIASGGDDQRLKIWSPDHYREQQILSGGGIAALKARISPDGSSVATGYIDGSIKLWSRENGELLSVLREGHDYLANAARFVRDHQVLVTAAGDNTLRIWDVERGTQTAVLENSGRNIRFAVSRDERWLVSTGDQNGIPIWSLDKNVEVARLKSLDGDALGGEALNGKKPFAEPSAIAISGEGKKIASANREGFLTLWNVETKRPIRTWKAHKENIVECFFASAPSTLVQGECLVAVSTDGSISTWNTETGDEVPQSRIQTYAPLQSSAISKDGAHLACSAPLSKDSTRVWIFDRTTGKKLFQEDFADSMVQSLDFEFDTREQLAIMFIAPQRSTKSVTKIDLVSGQAQTFPVEGARNASLWGVLNDPTRKRLVTYGGRGARLWSTKWNRLISSFRPNVSICEIQYTPDGSQILSGSRDGTIQMWSVQDGRSQLQWEKVHPTEIVSMQFSSVGDRLISVDKTGLVVLWDVERAKPMQTAQLPIGMVPTAAVLSRDVSSFWIALSDGRVLRLDPKTLEIQAEMKAHSETVGCLALTANGLALATGSNDKSICVWDLSTNSKLATLVGHSAAITSLEFSRDSMRLLSSSQDTSVRIWDTRSIGYAREREAGRTILGELMALNYHRSAVNMAEFSSDGGSILSVGQEGDSVVWESEELPPHPRATQDQVEIPTLNAWSAVGHLFELSVPTPGNLSQHMMEVDCGVQDSLPFEVQLQLPVERYQQVGAKLLAKASEGGEGVPIAEIQRPRDSAKSLRLKPLRAATPAMIQDLLGAIAVRAVDSDALAETQGILYFRVLRAEDESLSSETQITLALDSADRGIALSSPADSSR